MFFIQWTTASASAAGSAWRLVQCEHCQTPYVFLFETSVRSTETELYSGGSEQQQERAEQAAERNLEWHLRNVVEPVPCPACHQYQPDMCDKLKQERYGRLYTAGMFALIPAFLGLLIAATYPFDKNLSPETAAIALSVSIGSLVICSLNYALKKWVWSRYDPNVRISIEKRMQVAQDKGAMTQAEFTRRYPEVIEND